MKPRVCIHGHFYQPPRENPWTGAIEPQPTAAPYPNWNHRITDECYRPNCHAVILDDQAHIVQRRLTYSRISFDFGPTLLRWLEVHAQDVYACILEADRRSRRRLGHGNAIAQPYHHVILPLCSPEDRRREVRWGVRDFRERFGREPEGMWLPETAVDLPTLRCLAQEGLRFVVLAPHQAQDPEVDTTIAHAVEGADIAAFFYDARLARGVAFDGLLHNGAHFARTLKTATSAGLANLATDGESYGHHHRHGEMALAWCINALQEDPEVELTNYAAFLAEEGTSRTTAIVEGSSWSCVHELGRWSTGCPCGHAEGADSSWRPELRAGLNWLRDTLGDCEGELLKQRMAMFTSCGWFFDDPAGLEPVQNLRHAARAIALSGRPELEGELLERLPSFVQAWQEEVRPLAQKPTSV